MALAAGISTTLVARGPAGAATEGSLKAQAAALSARLDQLAQQEARADEQYNQAQAALGQAVTRQQQAQAAANRASAQVSSRRRVLASAAVDAYMQGGGAGAVALLMQATQSTYALRQSYLQSVADSQQAAIDGLREAEAQLATRQAGLARATQAARSDVTRAASIRSRLTSTAGAELSALSQVKGQLARMVAADQAAAQAAAAAAARARLAAANQARQRAVVSRDNPLPTLGGGGAAGFGGGGGGSRTPAPGAVPPQSGAAGVALQWAQRELGKPYEYGASGPDSFDCSGLTMYVYGQAGVGLPHSAAGQWDDTTRISYSEARPGDLVFFYQPVDHVGIYVGNGEMIDAPHTGASVEYDPIWWNVLDGFGRVG